jgi:hypothetical protein
MWITDAKGRLINLAAASHIWRHSEEMPGDPRTRAPARRYTRIYVTFGCQNTYMLGSFPEGEGDGDAQRLWEAINGWITSHGLRFEMPERTQKE